MIADPEAGRFTAKKRICMRQELSHTRTEAQRGRFQIPGKMGRYLIFQAHDGNSGVIQANQAR
jgi:hypothetical protein